MSTVQEATQAIPQRDPLHTAVSVTLVTTWALMGVCAVLGWQAHRSGERVAQAPAWHLVAER